MSNYFWWTWMNCVDCRLYQQILFFFFLFLSISSAFFPVRLSFVACSPACPSSNLLCVSSPLMYCLASTCMSVVFQVMDWLALPDEEKLPDLKAGQELPIIEVRLIHE